MSSPPLDVSKCHSITFFIWLQRQECGGNGMGADMVQAESAPIQRNLIYIILAYNTFALPIHNQVMFQ